MKSGNLFLTFGMSFALAGSLAAENHEADPVGLMPSADQVRSAVNNPSYSPNALTPARSGTRHEDLLWVRKRIPSLSENSIMKAIGNIASAALARTIAGQADRA
jgi:hypothetical protein